MLVDLGRNDVGKVSPPNLVLYVFGIPQNVTCPCTGSQSVKLMPACLFGMPAWLQGPMRGRPAEACKHARPFWEAPCAWGSMLFYGASCQVMS